MVSAALYAEPLSASHWMGCPKHEFGLDVIVPIDVLRHHEHRSVPDILALLRGRGLEIAKRRLTDNITSLPLPPKCPELNVMESVRQFVRDNWLSNRVFVDHDDIVAQC